MHPSTALATVLVDELVRCGVREAVLSPGSRSAPLAYALQQADRDGRLRLHVRVDERSAGFLALGLAKVSRNPAVVVTTSGSAAANLHPAVLESHHAAVPLVALTADRPVELRGTGANQTTVQPGLYGAAVRWQADLPPAEGRPGEPSSWRSAVARAVAAATGALAGGLPAGGAGPVHLNVAFRDPLAPATGPASPWPESLDGRQDGAPWVRVTAPGAAERFRSRPLSPRTVVVLGDLPDPELAREALELLTDAGRPVVAEPFGAGRRAAVLPHGPLLLADDSHLQRHAPEQVLVVGRVTLSRDVAGLLRRAGTAVDVVTPTCTWPDPGHVASRVHPWEALAGLLDGPVDLDWSRSWVEAGAALGERVAPALAASWPSGPAVAATVLRALEEEDTLVLGSSNPSRDADLAGFDPDAVGHPLVVGNRGLAGIDGTVSSAVGVALTTPGRTVALLGDLTFLHDANGLVLGPDEPRPDLLFVVVNDDGGGIFTTLEHGEPQRAGEFERIFGTPTGTDLASLCRAHGVSHARVGSAEDLAAEVAARPTGLRVVEVVVDRAAHRGLRERLRELARGG